LDIVPDKPCNIPAAVFEEIPNARLISPDDSSLKQLDDIDSLLCRAAQSHCAVSNNLTLDA
jgi:hypothetical protein